MNAVKETPSATDCLLKPAQVRAMFGEVAPGYDLLNHLLSGGMDFYWRHVLVETVRAGAHERVLDVACGTGDVCNALRAALGKTTWVVGSDFCLPMLKQARAKGSEELCVADALQLPFASESFDVVTVAFGLRNFANRRAYFQEVQRVLRPGGRLCVLEFTQPWRVIRGAYFLYLKNVLPMLARLLGSDPAAYSYLSESIQKFPAGDDLAQEFLEAGFKKACWRGLTLGTVALHVAQVRK